MSTPLAAVALAAVLAASGALALGPSRHLALPEHRAGTPSPDAAAGAAGDAPRFAVEDVVASARHRVAPLPGRPGHLGATDEDFGVDFDRAGFELTPTGADVGAGISLRSARRGARDLPLAIRRWEGRGTQAERSVAPGMREVVHVRNGAIEWDVVLGTAPSGHGDLVVSADLTGATGTPGSDDLTLADGSRLHLGQVLVKDDIGVVRHRARPTVEGGSLRLVVPAAVLDGATYPLTLDPTVSPQRTVSAATGTQTQPDVAFDGIKYLVVWQDSRTAASTGSDIYGALVDANGALLDANAIPISTAAGNQSVPKVTFYGSGFLVVWEDTTAGDIYMAELTTLGRVLDPLGQKVNLTGFNVAERTPDLDFDGSNVGIVWSAFDAFKQSEGWNISGIGWSPALRRFLPSESPVSTAPGDQVAPVVEYAGRDYLVVWQDNREGNWDIYGAVVFSNGVVRDTAGVGLAATDNDQVAPDLAFDGARLLLVWQDFRAGTTSDIYGARWSPSSGLLDPAGIPISTAAGNQELPFVASSSPFLVAWQDRRSGTDGDVYGTRVRGDGSVADPSGLPISAVHGGVNEQLAGVGLGNGGWLTTYEGDGNIFARTVSTK